FERNATQIYVPDGTNVGCNYSRAAADAAMTFYAYQSDVVLQADVDNAFASMRQRVPVSKEVAFSELPGANWYLARALSYEEADGQAMRTSVLIGESAGWRLKIRLTCPAAE